MCAVLVPLWGGWTLGHACGPCWSRYPSEGAPAAAFYMQRSVSSQTFGGSDTPLSGEYGDLRGIPRSMSMTGDALGSLDEDEDGDTESQLRAKKYEGHQAFVVRARVGVRVSRSLCLLSSAHACHGAVPRIQVCVRAYVRVWFVRVWLRVCASVCVCECVRVCARAVCMCWVGSCECVCV
jgi:hypothetical protein